MPTQRETMTTGQAAARLKISLASLRRRVDAGVIEAYREAKVVDTDIRGFKLRGHRRVFVDSVEAYERALIEQTPPGVAVNLGPDSNPREQNS